MTLDRSLGLVLPSDAFPRASFDGVEFPYSEVSVKGGIRYSIHEFPHANGGEPEKMGRKPYVITFKTTMQSILGSDLEREYPDAYPTGMRLLREKFEIQLSAALVVPTIGKIRAVATDWIQRFDAKAPSGESFDIEFLEDQESIFLTSGASGLASSAAAAAEINDELAAAAALAEFKKEQTLSVFQQINDAVTAVQGAVAMGDAFARVVEGKIRAVVSLCAFADSSLEELQNPQNHLVIAALKDLWLAHVELADNVIETTQTIREWTVPTKMAIGAVSSRLYGTSERGGEILQLNGVDDAFAIPAGTVLRYVADARSAVGG
jgi:prophage DNA circulation protein